MPVLSFGHSKFWRARANTPAPPGPLQPFSAYPMWQASVITPALLGFLQFYWEKLVYCAKWFVWAWASPLTTDQQRAIREAILVVQHPAWTSAQDVVFDTSRAEGFHDYMVWNVISDQMSREYGLAENMWRHQRALLAHRQTHPDIDNPTRNLLIELAYHEFAASGRGKPTMDR